MSDKKGETNINNQKEKANKLKALAQLYSCYYSL